MYKKIAPLSLLLLSSAVHAGGFLGAGVGQSSADVEGYPGVSVTNSDTAFKLFGGYEFNENIAIEAGYTSLGEFGAEAAYFDPYWGYVTVSGMTEGRALYVAAVATIPLGPVGLFGKIGLAHWVADSTYREEDSYYIYTETDSATGIDPVVGVGIKFNISPTFTLRGEFERYMDVGDPAITGQSDIDVISVNAVFKF